MPETKRLESSTDSSQLRRASRTSDTRGRALGIAVETFRSVRALDASGASVVATRLFRHHATALRHHLALRIGVDAAVTLASRIESALRAGEASEEPTPEARLYRAAREALAERADERAFAPDSDAYWSPRDPARAAHAEALVRLRAELPLELLDVLELRHARSLTQGDVAYVLGLPEDEIARRLEAGTARAVAILGAQPASRDGTIPGALLEAFALTNVPRGRASRAEHPLLPIGSRIGDRYVVEAHLGEGSFADVYRVRDEVVPDHVVALKLLHVPAINDDSRRHALHELQLIAAVFHPSVVQLKDHGWHEDRLWFVMPLYRGETLADRLARGPLAPREARSIFEPLARALAAMHRAGIRHQDVKPENVFLARLELPSDEGGEAQLLPVLLDLGVAAKDAEVVIAGTPDYFAPEVAARFTSIPDAPALTGKADVFSLALALRNALDPGSAEGVLGGAIDAFVRHRALHPVAPPRSPALHHLVPSFERWLALSPDARPDAATFATELAALTAPEERRARRRGFIRRVIPLALAVVTVFGAIVYTVGREARFQALDAEQARAQAHFQQMQAALARERAASIRADLEAEEARRRELETDIRELEESYRTSRLTREELAVRLARTEGGLRLMVDERRTARARARSLSEELDRLGQQNVSLASDLASARGAHDTEARRLAAANAEAQALRAQLVEAQASAEDANARIAELRSSLRSLGEAIRSHAPPAP